MKLLLKKIVSFAILSLAVYLMLRAKYAGEYAHAFNIIDDDERFPLWYPYEVVKRISGIEFGDWRDYSFGSLPLFMQEPILWDRPAASAPRVNLKNISRLNVSSNVVCGVTKRMKDDSGTGYEVGHYFLFARNMPQVRFYHSDEKSYFADCLRHGIDGGDLKTFDEYYSSFLALESHPNILEVLKNPIVSGISIDELLTLGFIFLVWSATFGRLFLVRPKGKESNSQL